MKTSGARFWKSFVGAVILAGFTATAWAAKPASPPGISAPKSPFVITPGTMTLPFPGEQDYGRLYLAGPARLGEWIYAPSRRLIAKAKGTVTFKQHLPLIFAPNDSISDQPEVFRALPADAFIYLDCERLSMDDKDIDYITHFKTLRFLNMEGTEITDAALGKIKTLSQLLTLDFFGTNVRGSGIKELVALKNLRRLRLGCNKLDLACIADLTRLNTLELLNLDRVNLTDGDLIKLLALKNLRALEIPNNKKLTVAGIATLKKFPSLRTIDLRSCGFTAQQLTLLADSHITSIGLMPEDYTAKDREMLRAAFKGKIARISWISREETINPELFRPLK